MKHISLRSFVSVHFFTLILFLQQKKHNPENFTNIIFNIFHIFISISLDIVKNIVLRTSTSCIYLCEVYISRKKN